VVEKPVYSPSRIVTGRPALEARHVAIQPRRSRNARANWSHPAITNTRDEHGTNGASGPSIPKGWDRPRRALRRSHAAITRPIGLVLLVDCAIACFFLHSMVTTPPIHETTIAELLVGLIVMLTGTAGAAMLIVGPALFRRYTWPPRQWEYDDVPSVETGRDSRQEPEER
jgi:hypothetical protein